MHLTNPELVNTTQAAIEESFGEALDDLQMFDFFITDYDGYDCVTYSYVFNMEGYWIYAADFLINTEEVAYRITYYIHDPDFDEYQPVFEEIATSFEFMS